MLLALPKKNQYIFSSSGQRDRFADELEHFAINFVQARTRASNKLQNPRIKLISLRTFRHWKATMLYHRTKDILFVKESLGHVNIQNTLRYIHLANAIATIQDEYVCKAAKTVKEASELIENGFEYVCELDDARLFRKRK
jgi:integrase